MQFGKLGQPAGKENHLLQLFLYGFYVLEEVIIDAFTQDVRCCLMMLRIGETG